MPNDDLGTFPMPPQAPTSPAEPAVTDPAFVPLIRTPDTSTEPTTEPTPSEPSSFSEPVPTSEPTPTPTETPISQPQAATFEETPEEIPSFQQPSVQPSTESTVEPPSETPATPIVEQTPEQPPIDLLKEQETLVSANEDLIDKQTTPPETISPIVQPEPTPMPVSETPATLPPKTGGASLAPIIIVILLVVAGAGLAFSAYLSAQTSQLKKQLEEITQTKEKQETTLTPTASPTVFEAPTPTVSMSASESATISATPTVSLNSNALQPLANAAAALKIAINKSPNAQLILIKIDNATDTTTAVTKYFFRQDLSTKKYFYVAVTGKGIPDIVDKQVIVSPDDNIPSLNDPILTNKLGIDLDAALKLSYAQCANQEVCTTAPVKAQYIKTGTGIIWQLSLYTKGLSSNPLLIQINAETREILYKSPEFANK